MTLRFAAPHSGRSRSTPLTRRRSILLAALALAAALAAVGLSAGGQPAEARRGERSALVDRSRAAGIFEVSRTFSANVGDFNRDGWEDVLVVRHFDGFPRLYRNDRGRFTDVTAEAFPRMPEPALDRHDCAFADVNRDSLPDFFCSVGGKKGLEANPSELWIQQPERGGILDPVRGIIARPSGRFEEAATEYGVQDPFGRGRAVTFLDANRDGFVDLFVGNAFPRQDGQRSTNKLFINVRGERFREARGYGVNREVGGRTAQTVDYDRDGFQDLLVCGQTGRGVRLYRNVRGRRFDDVTRELGLGQDCEAALITNFDANQDPDLVTVSEDRVEVTLRSRRRGPFRAPSFVRGLDRGVALAVGQVNGDGRRDVFVQQRGRRDRDARDLLLLNRRRGRDFESARIPQTRRGLGQSVASVDHDRDGRTDFIVLDGHGAARGPIRLLAARWPGAAAR